MQMFLLSFLFLACPDKECVGAIECENNPGVFIKFTQPLSSGKVNPRTLVPSCGYCGAWNSEYEPPLDYDYAQALCEISSSRTAEEMCAMDESEYMSCEWMNGSDFYEVCDDPPAE